MIELFEKFTFIKRNEFLFHLSHSLSIEKKIFIITANPETIMRASNDQKFREIFLSKRSYVIADGIGIIKVAKKLGYKNPERIAGIEVTQYLLEEADKKHLKILIYGSSQNTLEKMERIIKRKYLNIKKITCYNGYTSKANEVKNEIKVGEYDLIFVALGVPKQELFIADIFDCVKKGVFIGVGGSFDVLSGNKRRAPKILIKLNLEWLYRIMSEPFRIKRFMLNNIKYLYLSNREIKGIRK